jgi:hypothetical protein
MTTENPLWPFAGPVYDTPRGPLQTYQVSATDRLDAVKRMNHVRLKAALRVPDLQKSVQAAIERRLRQLAKESA